MYQKILRVVILIPRDFRRKMVCVFCKEVFQPLDLFYVLRVLVFGSFFQGAGADLACFWEYFVFAYVLAVLDHLVVVSGKGAAGFLFAGGFPDVVVDGAHAVF